MLRKNEVSHIIYDIHYRMNAAAIIPSRYFSTRLEGKPLIDIAGKPMVQRVYESAQKAQLIDQVVVATDDRRILETVIGFGGKAELTSTNHLSGTDRIAEVADRLSCDIVVNLQGDEPLMESRLIDEVVRLVMDNAEVYMASAKSPIRQVEELTDPNVVKVVSDCDGYALYFSRSPIPYCPTGSEDLLAPIGFKHIGLYVYKKDFLMKFVALGPSPLEKQERLEQLRALENGYRIKLVYTEYDSIGVDTPEDVKRVIKKVEERKD